MKNRLFLLCCPKQWISDPSQGKHYSIDFDLHVLNSERRVEPHFELMCAAIDEAMDVEVLQAWIVAVESLEAGHAKRIEKSTEGWVFQMTSQSVTFEGEFDQGSGGEVTLKQFKLAVSTFRDFLNDPERKPVEVPFPEE